MATSNGRGVRLRVGVIGLGRLWEARHKPALLRMADRFRVVAVYDQVAGRAAIEARHLGCVACEGLTALIERPDVDVVYLLAPQWFGLHPAALACRAGKPIYCGLPIAADLAALVGLAPEVRAGGLPFMVELARRFYPATLRLRELLATTLGRPRMILGLSRLYGFDRYGPPGPTTQVAPAPLIVDPGTFLLDWCRFLVGAEPVELRGGHGRVLPGASEADPDGPDFECFTASFPGGEVAQMTMYRYHREAWGEANRFLPQPGFQVFAERGAAWLEMPDRLLWQDVAGHHEERLPLEPGIGEVLNDHFHRLVRGDQSLAPGFEDALTLARHVEALQSASTRTVP